MAIQGMTIGATKKDSVIILEMLEINMNSCRLATFSNGWSSMKQPVWHKEGLQHIWFPYTQMQTAPDTLPVVSAKGAILTLEDGGKLIDGIASWWSVCHGYQHPHIVKAITEQANKLSHVMFAGLAHEQAYRLASRLAKIAPQGLNRVFFSDSGSTAVEVAMKMALQYWYNQGNRKRSKFICFRNSYHGDTMGAMSMADPDDGMHSAFMHAVPKQYVIDLPYDEYGFEEFEYLVNDIAATAAGVMIEPLVQGAGGMRFHTADILAEIHRITKKYELLFIADEVATGFGRTGNMFACEEAGISPDIMCIGKGLTGGHIGLAATLATNQVFEAFLSDKLEHALMHGPTYMGNPIACAAANASLDLFEKEPRMQQVEAIEDQLREELELCRKLSGVLDVRVKGAIGVVELDNPGWDTMFALRQEAIKHGVWLRPFGNIMYVMPAFTITEKELTKLTQTIHALLK